ncbi:MAG TPA: hypothetical protein VK716_07660 [Terracidiphilus sp.]|nr:hypothetical protein [Terracidiphilus sp.]
MRETVVEVMISSLALTVESLLLRIEALQQVIEKEAPHLKISADEMEVDLQSAFIRKRCAALRARAVEAIRNGNETEAGNCISDLRGLALHILASGRGV